MNNNELNRVEKSGQCSVISNQHVARYSGLVSGSISCNQQPETCNLELITRSSFNPQNHNAYETIEVRVGKNTTVTGNRKKKMIVNRRFSNDGQSKASFSLIPKGTNRKRVLMKMNSDVELPPNNLTKENINKQLIGKI